MRILRIRRAQLGGAGETSSADRDSRSTTTTVITHDSAADRSPAPLGSALPLAISDSDSVSTGSALYPRHHEDKHESRTTKVVAGTVAGVGMLLLGGIALICFMVWRQRRRRKREHAYQQARS